MKRTLLASLLISITCTACSQQAQTPVTAAGQVSPAGWQCGATGGGHAKWTLEPDTTGQQVLKQSGNAVFPWCVKPDSQLENGYVEVRFMPLAGNEDRAGGVVWRWQDGDNYYVARANALENNVALYYTANGNRHTLRSVDVLVGSNTWHRLRVEFSGQHIRVILDGKAYIEFDDRHFKTAGKAGVWTKADSVTQFSDFHFEPSK